MSAFYNSLKFLLSLEVNFLLEKNALTKKDFAECLGS